ncbi:hypothetical protein ILUMI_19938 [Ignelater luminosus]|uniref:Uncharacterized protein n=1 Tax=Ignelater luminosus TaxID=2038154 RepID=A0A8K0CF77_IGNLU|nr:hypothetical protein ILUMI_19938 [Ignelater luminosus]
MDDETYVQMDSSTLPGLQFYNTVVGQDVPDKAICSCRLKALHSFTTGTIGGEVYRKECIQKRLVLPSLNDNIPHYSDQT